MPVEGMKTPRCQLLLRSSLFCAMLSRAHFCGTQQKVQPTSLLFPVQVRALRHKDTGVGAAWGGHSDGLCSH